MMNGSERSMDFQSIINRARTVRAMYAEFEVARCGKEWSTGQIFQGFVGDVGDLSKLISAKEGIRSTTYVDNKLAHEFADCLWCLIVLADRLGINLERAFLEGMTTLEARINSEMERL